MFKCNYQIQIGIYKNSEINFFANYSYNKRKINRINKEDINFMENGEFSQMQFS